jgi:(S)-2-hydroxyglutarate dehydrogenase
MYDFIIIGGGIVGLATAVTIGEKYPHSRISVLEKESSWGYHQTSRNSGVIHSGIYYQPGSLKANFCRSGNQSIVEFCQKYNIEHEICGKVIVATNTDELPALEKIYERGLANGLTVNRLTASEVCDVEPHVRCLAGLQVPSTGIVNYHQVANKYVELIHNRGGELYLDTQVNQIINATDSTTIVTNNGEFNAKFIVNCAGLHSDRVAKLGGINPNAKIVPFRGEYYELKPEKRYLVKHLIYPVPNPDFPFLGVHFTRMIDGSIHAGPNAVVSFQREGYHKTDINLRDLTEIFTYPGLWKLAARHVEPGIKEIIRSFSKAAFVQSLQQLIPEIQSDDIIPAHSGVRAQALRPDGKLVDDFLLESGENAIHVCNAPSPAATSSLEIGKEIVKEIGLKISRPLTIV